MGSLRLQLGRRVFDLTIIGWLIWRRTRPMACVVLVAFHLTTYLLFPQIGVFPWLMTGAVLLLFSPDWPRLVLLRLRGASPSTSAGTEPVEGASAHPSTSSGRQGNNGFRQTSIRWQRVLVVAAVAAYVAVQVALPLRHYAYPGNVRWNEEGYRFSWRVLLTEKVGMVEYRVYDPLTGERWRVGPEDYLTPLQSERMATQPDMILETAHIIARDFAVRGHLSVEVRADVFVSMNGRENARLVDPDVDLAAANNSLAPKEWLLPRQSSSP